jgi:hypothetical protein
MFNRNIIILNGDECYILIKKYYMTLQSFNKTNRLAEGFCQAVCCFF